jgi:hypothetical protein
MKRNCDFFLLSNKTVTFLFAAVKREKRHGDELNYNILNNISMGISQSVNSFKNPRFYHAGGPYEIEGRCHP